MADDIRVGRRSYDDLPLIVEGLRRDMEHAVKRLDEIAERMLGSVDGLRADHGSEIREVKKRVDDLERWKDQKDGASGATRAALSMSFSAGVFITSAAGLVLRMTGHL